MPAPLEFVHPRLFLAAVLSSMAGGLAFLLSDFVGGMALSMAAVVVMLASVSCIGVLIFVDSRRDGGSHWRSTRTAFPESFRWLFSLL